ncbi:MAG TPA: ABC transporter ATP-binding protein/permease [Xanthobacteraceae bacterium]|nr:ABC transporter ATP-binding protein/permease [Xanthobacteraceae bacterium]
MRAIISKLAIIWRLASPYFRSEDRWAGRVLLAAVIAIELSLVAIDVMINHWNNRFYNALQDRDWDAFVSELLFFCMLAAAFILLAVYQLYLNQWLQIRWRRWMTQHYLERWLAGATHYRMQLLGDAADNPDQRIADDIKKFIDGENGAGILPIGIGLLSSVVTLASFIVILWGLSEAAPISLFGWPIPGYLVWAALIYALVGTLLTHLIGRKLVGLNFMQQRYEADFRFNLVRVRENSEQIGLLEGEKAETDRLLDRFGRVVTNWHGIMIRTKRLTFFTAGYRQASTVFPYIVVSPAYFSGAVQLGGLMQTASAFSSVQGALSFFINTYSQLAEWASVIDRLDGFDKATAAKAAAVTSRVIELHSVSGKRSLDMDDLAIRLPDEQPLVDADGISIKAGDRVLVTGPSGAGKSTLFRAIAGIWPFGSGKISVPADAEVMLLPQRPYFPVARLSSAIAYPAEPGTFDNETIKAALNAVGLPAMAERLEEEAHWNRMLSLGEQQRLGIARALLHAPDYLFLDEATASLDEAAEAAVYRLLQERLPRTTIVSIGHRSTLADFHTRRLTLVRDGDRHRLRETLLEAAAQ